MSITGIGGFVALSTIDEATALLQLASAATALVVGIFGVLKAINNYSKSKTKLYGKKVDRSPEKRSGKRA